MTFPECLPAPVLRRDLLCLCPARYLIDRRPAAFPVAAGTFDDCMRRDGDMVAAARRDARPGGSGHGSLRRGYVDADRGVHETVCPDCR